MPGDKINIAHMIATPSFGGPDATVLSLYQKLDPERYRQYLIFLKSPSTLNHTLVEKSRDLGIETILISTRGKVNLLSLVRALGWVKKNRIDILHSHNYKTDILTYYISRFYPVKIASTLHGWTERNRRMRFYKEIDFRFLKKFDLIKTVSSPLRQECLRRGIPPEKVVVIPNAVDLSLMKTDREEVEQLRRRFGLDPASPVIGMVGRLDREKNPELLLETIPILVKKHPGLRCFFVGEGPLKEELMEEADALGLDETVIFTGYRFDPLNFIALFDILILPSRTEGIPKALLESMALKVPAVATAVGGVPDVLRRASAGILVPPDDPEQIIARVGLLLRNPELRKRLGGAGRRLVEEEYSDRTMVARMDRFYRRLSGEKS